LSLRAIATSRLAVSPPSVRRPLPRQGTARRPPSIVHVASHRVHDRPRRSIRITTTHRYRASRDARAVRRDEPPHRRANPSPSTPFDRIDVDRAFRA